MDLSSKPPLFYHAQYLLFPVEFCCCFRVLFCQPPGDFMNLALRSPPIRGLRQVTLYHNSRSAFLPPPADFFAFLSPLESPPLPPAAYRLSRSLTAAEGNKSSLLISLKTQIRYELFQIWRS